MTLRGETMEASMASLMPNAAQRCQDCFRYHRSPVTRNCHVDDVVSSIFSIATEFVFIFKLQGFVAEWNTSETFENQNKPGDGDRDQGKGDDGDVVVTR